MKSFGAGGYMLSGARLEVRLVYTGFLVLTAIGFLTMAAFQLKHVGPTPADVAVYYRGGERSGEMLFPKGFRELAETTHFHAFMMGIVYLVLAHLLIATAAPLAVKRAAIVAGFLGFAGNLMAPWAIRYLSGWFAYLQLASWAGEWLSVFAFVLYPMHEMWFRHDQDADVY